MDIKVTETLDALNTMLKGNMRPDIEEAIKTFGNEKSQPNKKELKAIEEMLKEDEKVLYISSTVLEIVADAKKKRKESLAGVCVLTSQRFLFHKNEYKLLGIGVGGDTTETVSLDKIDSVNATNTAYFNHVQLHTITKSYNILCNNKKEMKLLQQVLENAVQEYQSTKNAPATTTDPVAQIKQLAELHEAGIISDAEFETKKAALLSRI